MKTNNINLVLNKNVNYDYNPFGETSNEELDEIVEPKYPIEEWIDLLQSKSPIIIQFVGRKGRGKTTHLRILHQLFRDTEVYFLNEKNNTVNTTKNSSIVFIDSVHHIPWVERFQLWRKTNITYVITTHWKRDIEFFLCGRSFKTYYFKGLSIYMLETILKKRISLSSSLEYNNIRIDTRVLQSLHSKYGDNLRGILNYLYDNFKTHNYGN